MYWYQFFTRCEELVPIFHGEKFAKCQICGSTGLTCSHYKPSQAISACVHHKIFDGLTQKQIKLIRTELVKMTSEASLLPTDLKNIHQTVYITEAGEKCFLNCRHELHYCLNALEIKKNVKENFFS